MEQRSFGGWSWTRALRDALIAILATLAYYSIGLLTSFSLPGAVFVAIGAVIFLLLTFLGDALWARDSFRYAALTISQRPLAYLICAGAVSAATVLLLVWVPPYLGAPALRILSSAPAALAEQAAVLGAGLVVLIACLLFDRPALTAAQCHTVLRRILRQWRTGTYTFDHGATRREIRQESRFLDYLARRSHQRIRRHWWGGYTFARSPTDPSVALKDICPGLAEGHLEASVACANAHWRQGWRPRNRWRCWGDEAQAVDEPEYTKQFFGNDLDALFNGSDGFRAYLPDGPGFLVMVIKGQPGAGKTTQALQLCVTLAKQGHYCLYYSLEEERESLLQTARNFGWATPMEIQTDARTVAYAGVQHLDFQAHRRRRRRAVAHLSTAGVWVSSLGDRAMPVAGRKGQLHKEWQQVEQVPRCVVIDSLEGFANVGLDLESSASVPRAELLSLKDFFRDRCQMLVVLVEDDGSGRPGYVDFVADVVIRLGRTEGKDYTLLIAEILKARNQSHALGSHQIKIRSHDDIARATGPIFAALKDLQPGVIVFPSLHYRLFQAQHRPATADYVLSTGLDGLDHMLPGIGTRAGVRRQAALALLGPSSTGKSVLALNFLVEGMRENTPTLLLQLHNDPATVTSRPIAQEPHRMHFSWRSETDVDTGRRKLFHQFAWTHEGIVRWWRQRQPPRGLEPLSNSLAGTPASDALTADTFHHLLRLPYLFRLGPLAQPTTLEEFLRYRAGAQLPPDRRQAIEQALAVEELLRSLAEYQPPLEADGTTPRWDARARRELRARYDAAWTRFVERVGAETLVAASAPPHEPKRIALSYADDGLDETAPAPFLQWDSRYWEPNKRHLIRAWDPQRSHPGGDGGTMYDTSLLVIRDFRPGNIAPDDFIARILHDIGEPTEESPYERVVFDDVSQLSQRFPLLADSPIFLPTVIDMFKATGITSLFLADTEDGDRAAQHGMAIMGDHVIRTSQQYVTSEGELLPPNQRGRRSWREIIIESDALPGDERQGPHILRVTPMRSRFGLEEIEECASVDDLPRRSNKLDAAGPPSATAG